jgi:uncharacterized protein with PIN domain
MMHPHGRCGAKPWHAFRPDGRPAGDPAGGRHPAALNLVDCFAYSCAAMRDVPLPCEGDDFPSTDIAIA